MDNAEWQRVLKVFVEATKCMLEDRMSFLEKACGEDAELLAEVCSLLDYRERVPTDFLDREQAREGRESEPILSRPDALIGEIVGQYQIIEVISTGGMGSVYLAEQARPKRPVAVKVMRSGIASPSTLQRFEHEGQILARLHHPHIAQVYEAGIHVSVVQSRREEVPYFAMELVRRGDTIIAYARRHELATCERLALFLQACDAVEHGHQKGIIHRDLKPGNILVDSDACVKIIDFGVAKATDSDVAVTTMQTDVGQIVGTLQYMSPEQCAIDPHGLDTRSDVYALGVVLYELLSGNLPYKVSGAIHTIARIICETPPTPLGLNDRTLRGDLETILDKALKKNREERYQSVASLADDVKRYLCNEPIEARPPTMWNRVVRWMGRHPLASTSYAATIIAACIIATAAHATWKYTRTPQSIECDGEMTYARLLPTAGPPLHVWQASGPSRIKVAQLVDRPHSLGGGKIALIGRSPGVNAPADGTLCAYAVDEREYEEPLWCDRLDDSALPDCVKLAGRGVEDFGVQCAFFHDIYAEVPGDEVVVVYAAQSERCVRILDLAGRVCFQAWYDGVISSTFWMPDVGLLVLSGNSGGPTLRERGFPEANARYADVVYAIRPQFDLRTTEFIGEGPRANEVAPVWHRFLVYPFAEVKTRVLQLNAEPSRSASEAVRLSVFVYSQRATDASIGMTIDVSGNVIPGTQAPNDSYLDDPELPSPTSFCLRERFPVPGD